MTGLTVARPKAPWIGIGVSGEWRDYREAMRAAELDFTVRQEELYWQREEKHSESGFGVSVVYNEPVPMYANVRDTDDRLLGCVSDRYGIVSNDRAFSLLEPFTDAGGVITNAGMTEQGLLFMVLRMRQQNMLGDDWDFDVMCTNSFNGIFPCALIMTPTRVICQNMYRKLMGGASDSILHVKHATTADQRIAAARKATASFTRYQAAFESSLMMANCKSLPAAEIEKDLLTLLFPYSKDAVKKEAMKVRVDEARKEFMDVYYAKPDNTKFHGTALGFINAYYDYLSHRNPGKMMPGSWEDRRLSGLVSGNDVKTKLITKALK